MKNIFEVLSIREEVYKNAEKIILTLNKKDWVITDIEVMLSYTNRIILNWFINYIILNTLNLNHDSILYRLENKDAKQFWNNLHYDLRSKIKDYISLIDTGNVKIKGTLDNDFYLKLTIQFGKRDYYSGWGPNKIFERLSILEAEDLNAYLYEVMDNATSIIERCEDEMNHLPTLEQLERIIFHKERYLEYRKCMDDEEKEINQIPWLRL